MLFNYVAYTVEAGVEKGRVEAQTAVEARAEVVRNGYKPIMIKPARRLPGLEELFPTFFSPGTGDLIRFSRHIASMLASGGNLLRALEMLQRESPNGVMRRIVTQIKATLDDGGSLSDALKQHPTVFTPLYVSVAEVGEYTGRLAPALEQVADMQEREQEAKAKAMRTMMYPVVIIVLSLLTMGVLITVALPPMLKVFDRMGADIPLVTRLTVGMFNFGKERFLEIIIVLVVVGVVLALARRVTRISYLIDTAMLRTPQLGVVIMSSELSRFSRTVAMLLDSGVSLSAALGLGISGCKNQVVRRVFTDAEESLNSGQGLTVALRESPILPSLFVELVMIGEESNSLLRIMNDAADTFQKQLERRLDSLLGLLEPASTLVVGGVVGLMAFSMFVPIYSGLKVFE